MDSALLRYAEQNAPRYTSYPTAPHFSPAIGDAQVRSWLSALPSTAALSGYIHVPYCRELCWYCGCNTYAARQDEPLRTFVDGLIKEITLVSQASTCRRLTELHWGGGTPNILAPRQFERILQELRDCFDTKDLSHHAIELDPRYIEKDQARAYAGASVNRVSLGVQDLNPAVQKAIGRVQPYDVVKRAVDVLRSAGIEAINIDLMYGLPHQSREDLLHSIDLSLTLNPSRIALFGYAHVPWFKKRQRLIPENALPDTPQRFDQADAARAHLEAAGFVAIGLDHFARPDDELAAAAAQGKLSRSFQGYEAGQADAIIGFGPSAISTLPHGYAQNVSDPTVWSEAIDEGKLAIARGHALDEQDRVRRRLISQIMCDFSGDLAPLGGAAACADEIAPLQPMIADGLVRISGDHVRVSLKGRPFCRVVALAFDAYAQNAKARHSRAV